VPPIELLDGDELIDMLESLELGLKPVKAFEIDRSFFHEFEAKLTDSAASTKGESSDDVATESK
jgi:hypothetical protein